MLLVSGSLRSSLVFPLIFELLTLIEGPAADFVGVVTSAWHLGSTGCYVALRVDCPTQTHLRLIR